VAADQRLEPDEGASEPKQEVSSRNQGSHDQPRRLKQPDFDPLLRNQLYPDADALFTFCPKTPEEIKDSATIILDTTTLLLPYAGTHSLQEIAGVYRSLIAGRRLVVPGQVAREFVSHRATKILELLEKLEVMRSKLGLPDAPNFPLLEDNEDYKRLLKLHEEARANRTGLGQAIAAVIARVRKWYLNDPVSVLYRELFVSGVVRDTACERESLLKDLDWRNTHDVPPGNKDKGKPDRGIGDRLIWFTVLAIGREKKDVIFVSSDYKKGDWVYFRDQGRLYPRQELVEEYRRVSEGGSLHIIELANLLELFNVTQSTVEEVSHKEQLLRLEAESVATVGATVTADHRQRVASNDSLHEWAEQIAMRVIRDKFVTGVPGPSYGPYDHILALTDAVAGVVVKLVHRQDEILAQVDHIRGYYTSSPKDRYILALVTDLANTIVVGHALRNLTDRGLAIVLIRYSMSFNRASLVVTPMYEEAEWLVLND
jgi:hypothetical protein